MTWRNLNIVGIICVILYAIFYVLLVKQVYNPKFTAYIDKEKSARIRFVNLNSPSEKLFITIFSPAISTHKIIRPKDWEACDGENHYEEIFYEIHHRSPK